MTSVSTLNTPALVVDLNRLHRNILGMQAAASAAGVKLRPHIKTHKSLAIAKRQIEAGASGLTCAKISEAEVMSAVCDDLFIAYPVVGETKYRRLDNLSELARTRVSVESVEGAEMLHDHLGRKGRKQEVMVKVETGLERTGVNSTELEGFLQLLSGMQYFHAIGFFTHEGQAYRCGNREGIEQVFADVSDKLARMKDVFIRVFNGCSPCLVR
jgi:D-serine deaminase-like pyridoxal phosphate-dependent protein